MIKGNESGAVKLLDMNPLPHRITNTITWHSVFLAGLNSTLQSAVIHSTYHACIHTHTHIHIHLWERL